MLVLIRDLRAWSAALIRSRCVMATGPIGRGCVKLLGGYACLLTYLRCVVATGPIGKRHCCRANQLRSETVHEHIWLLDAILSRIDCGVFGTGKVAHAGVTGVVGTSQLALVRT